MIVLYALILCGIVALSGSAIAAFYWAVKSGQFRNLPEGAKVIFQEDEPEGVATDRFPDLPARNRKS
jgi:cbb3-type cytochrome oxidase maturation protein